jgi:hypothetical protein
MIKSAETAFSRLKEAKKTVTKINGSLNGVEDSLKKDIKKSGKSISDTIAVMQELFLTPKEFKGIDGEVRLSDYLWRSGSFQSDIYSSGKNAEYALVHAEKEVEELLDQVNTFFEGPWTDYKTMVDKVEWNPFKEYEAIELEKKD